MPDIAPENIHKSPLLVSWGKLEPVSGGMYKSTCPVCKRGTLGVYRNLDTMELQDNDRCMLCGQSFIYDDMKYMRLFEALSRTELPGKFLSNHGLDPFVPWFRLEERDESRETQISVLRNIWEKKDLLPQMLGMNPSLDRCIEEALKGS